MEDDPAPKSRKSDRPLPEVSLQDLKDYYLDRADEGKRQAVEAALRDPDSRLSGLLSYLRSDWSLDAAALQTAFPRLASLPPEDVEAAESGKRFALRPLDKPQGTYRLIGPRNPDAPSVNREGGGKSRS